MQYECSTLNFASRAQHNSEMKTAAIAPAPSRCVRKITITIRKTDAQRLTLVYVHHAVARKRPPRIYRYQ